MAWLVRSAKLAYASIMRWFLAVTLVAQASKCQSHRFTIPRCCIIFNRAFAGNLRVEQRICEKCWRVRGRTRRLGSAKSARAAARAWRERVNFMTENRAVFLRAPETSFINVTRVIVSCCTRLFYTSTPKHTSRAAEHGVFIFQRISEKQFAVSRHANIPSTPAPLKSSNVRTCRDDRVIDL